MRPTVFSVALRRPAFWLLAVLTWITASYSYSASDNLDNSSPALHGIEYVPPLYLAANTPDTSDTPLSGPAELAPNVDLKAVVPASGKVEYPTPETHGPATVQAPASDAEPGSDRAPAAPEPLQLNRDREQEQDGTNDIKIPDATPDGPAAIAPPEEPAQTSTPPGQTSAASGKTSANGTESVSTETDKLADPSTGLASEPAAVVPGGDTATSARDAANPSPAPETVKPAERSVPSRLEPAANRVQPDDPANEAPGPPEAAERAARALSDEVKRAGSRSESADAADSGPARSQTEVAGQRERFVLLGREIPPGTSARLAWSPDSSISGLTLPTPVLVINGRHAGPTLCLTAAIHGDELNGIEIVRRAMYEIDPRQLHGRVIGVPIVNLQGFQRASRYLPDRRDLNRYFPGEKGGSLASRIAWSLFYEVLATCTHHIDLHTGSLRRNNLPQVRGDMTNPIVATFTEGFDDMAVVHGAGSPGMLRWAMVARGVPSVTLEMGESHRIDEYQIKAGVHGLNGTLDKLNMYERSFIWGKPRPVYYRSQWVRSDRGGILFNTIELGDRVDKGERLGVVTDPITNEETPILSPKKGRIIGMAVNQVVMPGFAAYHIGQVVTEEAIVEASTPQSGADSAGKTVQSNASTGTKLDRTPANSEATPPPANSGTLELDKSRLGENPALTPPPDRKLSDG